MREWIAFWNAPHSIYVNDRHRDVHYRKVADDVAAHVADKRWDVLDYGCGEALHAGRVAAAAHRLVLCDAAPTVRAALERRFAGSRMISVSSPENVEAMPEGSLDLIVLHSVAQYLSPSELKELLSLFRRLLRPQGRLIVGDVVPPSASPVADAWALVRFAAANGFLGAAIAGLVRTALSNYGTLRQRIGLSAYSESEMVARLAEAGFAATRSSTNLGHNQGRMTFVATLPETHAQSSGTCQSGQRLAG